MSVAAARTKNKGVAAKLQERLLKDEQGKCRITNSECRMAGTSQFALLHSHFVRTGGFSENPRPELDLKPHFRGKENDFPYPDDGNPGLVGHFPYKENHFPNPDCDKPGLVGRFPNKENHFPNPD